MAQKGHEIFSLIQDKLSYSPVDELENAGNLKQLLSKEQAQFKQKVEEVQLKLTSPTIENKDFEEKGNQIQKCVFFICIGIFCVVLSFLFIFF